MEEENINQEVLHAETLIDKANQAAKRLEEANKKYEELIKTQLEMEAKKILGGRSEAGMPAEKPKEETPQEYAKRILEGKT